MEGLGCTSGVGRSRMEISYPVTIVRLMGIATILAQSEIDHFVTQDLACAVSSLAFVLPSQQRGTVFCYEL